MRRRHLQIVHPVPKQYEPQKTVRFRVCPKSGAEKGFKVVPKRASILLHFLKSDANNGFNFEAGKKLQAKRNLVNLWSK